MRNLFDLKMDHPFFEFALHEFEHQSHVCHHLLLHSLEVGSYDVLEFLKLAAMRLQSNDLFQTHIMLDFQLSGLNGICPCDLDLLLEPALHHLLFLLDLRQPLSSYALRVFQHVLLSGRQPLPEVLDLQDSDEVAVDFPLLELLAGGSQLRSGTTSHAPRFLNDVSPIIIKRSYCMYNFRKIKKKKKNKPIEETTLTPQETLFQISDCKEEAVEPSEADLFISKFHQVDTPKQGLAPKSATNFVRYNEQRPKFSMAAKRKSSVQQKSSTHQYSQSQASGKEGVRFIYLKRHKTEAIEIESQREKTMRSKTVFSMGESCKWKNRPFSSQGRSQFLNLKDPISLKSMRRAPPFLVKNIKLESRYGPLYLQDY